MIIEELGGRDLTGRLLEIWTGRSGLPPEKEKAYRDLWILQARMDPTAAPLATAMVSRRSPCLHLGQSAPVAERLDLMRDYRHCEAGHGVVCPCGACKTCPDYSPADEP